MEEKSSMSPQEMLDLLDKKVEIFQEIKRLLPCDVWKSKFEASRKKILNEINDLIFSYVISEMVRRVPNYRLEDGRTSVDEYVSYVESLSKKYKPCFEKVINSVSSIQRKRMLMAIREEMMKEEKLYCLKQHEMGEKKVG